MKGFFTAAVSALALLPTVFGQYTNTTVNVNVDVTVNVYTCQSSNGCGIYPQGYICDSSSSIYLIAGFSQVCSGCSIPSYTSSTSVLVSVSYQSSSYYICQSVGGCGPYAFGYVCLGAEIDITIVGFVLCYSCNSSMYATVITSISYYQCGAFGGCGNFGYNAYCLGDKCASISGFYTCDPPFAVATVSSSSYYICKSSSCGIYPRGFVISVAVYEVIKVSISGFVVCSECQVKDQAVWVPNTYYVCALSSCGSYTYGQVCYSSSCNLAITGFILCEVCSANVKTITAVPAYPVTKVVQSASSAAAKTITVPVAPVTPVVVKPISSAAATAATAALVCPAPSTATVTVTVTVAAVCSANIAPAAIKTQVVVPASSASHSYTTTTTSIITKAIYVTPQAAAATSGAASLVKAAALTQISSSSATGKDVSSYGVIQNSGASKISAAFTLAAVAAALLI